MRVWTLPCGSFSANMYVVSDENGNAIVIDPINLKALNRVVHSASLSVQAVFLTHGHFDHAEDLSAIIDVFQVSAYIGKEDWDYLGDPHQNASYLMGRPLDLGKCSGTVSDGDRFIIGDLSIRVNHTPGHTPGSVTYEIENALFTGDTLFAGGVGRTDLSGGDFETLMKSLKKLSQFPQEYNVYPGHGPASCLMFELQGNPYFKFKE